MKKKKFAGFWRLEDESPWLTKDSINFIRKNIKKTHNVLEFGSGASTIFFAKHCKKIISFESGGYSVRLNNLKRSFDWYKLLTKKIENLKISNVELYLVHGYPQSSILYKHILSSLPNNFFHWVLVDGTNRRLCIEKSIEKLVNGGYLIIDNYDHIPEKKHISSFDLFMKNEYCLQTMNELLGGWKLFKFDEDDWPGKGTIIFKKPGTQNGT